MYHTVYIDVFFLENLLTDYLVLTLVNRSLKLGSGRLRRLTGACVGSLGLCLLYLFPGKGIPWIVRFFGALVFYLGLSSLMIRCGLRIPGRSLFGKALFLLYFVSFLLGGVFRWLQEAVEVPVFPFLFFSLVSYGILKLGLKGILRVRTGQQSICQVTLGFHGNTLELRGLLDTGNQLQDPVTGEAVHILGTGGRRTALGRGNGAASARSLSQRGKADGTSAGIPGRFHERPTGRQRRAQRTSSDWDYKRTTFFRK